jgi:RND family efflux transporter MFP subunit
MLKIFKSKITIGIVVVLILGTGGFFLFHKGPTYQFVTVTRGSVAESVSLTGNTTPLDSVSLAFGASGIISHTYSDLGKKVNQGQILAEQNTNDLVAQLSQAQANVDAQQARLDGIKNGSRPEDIATSQASLDKAKQDLANMYTSIGDISIDSYAKANDAVRTQLDPFFINGETQSPTLSFTPSSTQSKYDTETQRLSSGIVLNKWSLELTNIDSSNTGLETLLQDEVSYLATVRQLLSSVSNSVNNAPSLSASTLSIYKANISIALNEVNTATKNLNTISQNIDSQKLTVLQLQTQLTLKQAPSLPSDISAQEAQVAQAQASVKSVAAKLENVRIVAPISGTITQFDAKIGQLASPGTPLVSIMGSGGYEIDAGVSETDIGKTSIGDKVSMTLDAFQNESFTGSVFYIAPAETNKQGVITYQIKISFDKIDPRLKSGLTANIDIQTKYKDSVLILPQYAILQNDQGTFVEMLENNKIKQNPVVLGIEDQKGNVEVISGVTENEQVLNIGLKTP